jgi:hypothetical protein
MSARVDGGMLELISPWTLAALAASVIAFHTSTRGLQLGPAVEGAALMPAPLRAAHQPAR